MNFHETLVLFANRAAPLEIETISIKEACGRIIAKEVRALLPNPPFHNSRWDGFALNLGDCYNTQSNHGRKFLIDREKVVVAGAGIKSKLTSGYCCPIMSGALVPEGTDAIVKIEDADVHDNILELKRSPCPGEGIIKAGSFWNAGELLIAKGVRITLLDLFKLAEAGTSKVEVFRRPRMAILAIGDELIEPGSQLKEACRYAGVQYLIKGLALSAGASVLHEAILKDDLKRLTEEFFKLSHRKIDLVVTVGGTGRGIKDLVTRAWKDCGAEMLFNGLPIIPGKSSSGGVIGNTLWLALPGGFMGALIVFMETLRTLNCRWYSCQKGCISYSEAVLGEDIRSHESMYRGIFGKIENRKGTLTFLPNLSRDVNFLDIEGYIIVEPGKGIMVKNTICEFINLFK